MKTSSKEIENAINEILGISEQTKLSDAPKKRGRKKLPKQKIWSLDFYDPQQSITYALISICIKEDFDQSLEQLAMRLSIWKSRPLRECMRVLRRLKKAGKLGYYDECRVFRTWNGEEKGYGLESMCG